MEDHLVLLDKYCLFLGFVFPGAAINSVSMAALKWSGYNGISAG